MAKSEHGAAYDAMTELLRCTNAIKQTFKDIAAARAKIASGQHEMQKLQRQLKVLRKARPRLTKAYNEAKKRERYARMSERAEARRMALKKKEP